MIARTMAVGFAVLLSGRLLLAQAGSTAPVATSAEAGPLAQAWSLLSQGDAARAAGVADALLARFPRSNAALALAIEAHTRRAGALAGLDAYERWLGGRKTEEHYALRHVELSALRETARGAQG